MEKNIKLGSLYEYQKYVAEKILATEYQKKSNCIGTSLWHVGEQDEDNHQMGEFPDKIFDSMRVVRYPVVGAIVAWKSRKYRPEGDYYHAGVVSKIDFEGVKVTGRPMYNGKMEYYVSLKEVNRYQGPGSDKESRYLIPSKMEKAMSFFEECESNCRTLCRVAFEINGDS